MSSIVNKVFHRNSTDSKDLSNTSIGSTDSKSLNNKTSQLNGSTSPTSPTSKTAGLPPSPVNGTGRSASVARSDGSHKHTAGHSEKRATDLSSADPANVTQEVHHLAHVTKETKHQHEIEEVERQRTLHSHHQHVQHHVQPIAHSVHGTEKVVANAHPVTNIHEKHSSTDSDATLLDSVTSGHKDEVNHAALDRKVVDKGEFTKEIEHHHIANVIQPVVHQDSHDYKRIQTVIPTTHTVHHAPIVHESTHHEAISKDEFLKNGGILGANVKNARDLKVLHDGKCERKVDGMAEKLEQKLGLAPGAATATTV